LWARIALPALMIAVTKTTRIKTKAATAARVAARMGNRPAHGKVAVVIGRKAIASNNSKVETGRRGKDQKAVTGLKVAGAIARRATGPMETASNISKAATARMGSRQGQGLKVAVAIARRVITTGAIITARGQITPIIQTTVNHETIIRPMLNK
jgi:hypothetical protein